MSIIELRVVKDLDSNYTVRECVFSEEGDLELLGMIPVFPAGKTPEELLDDFSMIAEAFQKEAIFEEDLDIEEADEELVGIYEAPEGYH